jgi:hypothetical protein
MARCSICYTLIQPSDEISACPVCRQEYHASCWTELGGCATFGCSEAAVAEKPAPVAFDGGWGDTKTCPNCGRTLTPGDLDCWCGARFPTADPMTEAEYRRFCTQQARSRSHRKTIVILFVLSLLGFPSPVTGTIAGYLAHRGRHDLAGGDGTYLAIGYGALAHGVAFTMIVLLLALGA